MQARNEPNRTPARPATFYRVKLLTRKPQPAAPVPITARAAAARRTPRFQDQFRTPEADGPIVL